MSHARLALLLALLVPSALRAQVAAPVGSEEERLLRWFSLLGTRTATADTTRSDSAAPARAAPGAGSLWTMRGLTTDGVAWLPRGFAALPVSASLTANSGFAFGENDGPLWAGRGLTGAVSGGVSYRRGGLTVIVAPFAFLAQNAPFALTRNGRHGDTAYADGRFPLGIDRPQRFGPHGYARLDPGETAVRFQAFGLAAGATSGEEEWGPAARFPLILGDNAAGIPRVWVGTSRPRDLWLFTLHARIFWGRLDASPYFLRKVPDRRRYASGVVASLQPRGVPGLEIGGGRFFHEMWPAGGLSLRDLKKPLEGIFKKSLSSASDSTGDNPDNQLLSVFARWAFPGAGFEIYGEYGREDHNWDLEDALLEPDHSAAYTLGFAKVWRTRDGWPAGLRAEVLNARKSRLDLVRSQPVWYTHGANTAEGHTQLGQILGTDAAFGGAGAWVAYDRYDALGRWTVSWTRELRMAQGTFVTTGVVNPRGLDVWHALTFERLWRTARMDVTGSVTAVYELNRDFQRDAFNLNLQLHATVPLGRFDPRLPAR